MLGILTFLLIFLVVGSLPAPANISGQGGRSEEAVLRALSETGQRISAHINTGPEMTLNAAQTRLREQCFLVAYIDQIANRNIMRPGDPNYGTADFVGDIIDATEDFQAQRSARMPDGGIQTASGATRTYSNFTPVMTANPGTLINKLVAGKGLAQLFNLSPAQMSAVMPKMRFYKMVFMGPDDRIGVAHEFTFRQSYPPEDVRTMINDRKGRGTGVGIKSFNWELIGTNTAEVENNIKAELTLYFQNFSDFVDEDVIQMVMDARDPAVNAVTNAQEDLSSRDTANYLDFIFRTSKYSNDGNASTSGQREWNDKYFRIKAVLGWQVDKNLVGGTDQPAPGKLFTEELAEKINTTGTTLLLSLLEHSIDFREDGTIELKLSYHAAVESMLGRNAANVLFLSSGEQATLDRANEQIEQLSADQQELETAQQAAEAEERADSAGDMPPEEGCEDPWEDAARSDMDFDEEIKTVEEAIARAERDRSYVLIGRYSKFLRDMIEGQRLYNIDAPKSFFTEESASRNMAASHQVLMNQTGGRTIQRGVVTTGFVGAMHARMLQASAEDDASMANIGASLEGNDGWWITSFGEQASLIPVGFGAAGTPDPLFHRFSFFYLGDLLNLALESLKTSSNPQARQELEDIKIIIGTIFTQLPSFRTDVTSDRPFVINIADIPISTALFIQFFNDRVISQGRTNWPLRTFIKEVLQLLVYPALGSGCAERPRRRPRTNISMTNISAYGGENNENRIPEGTRVSDTQIDDLGTFSGRHQDRRMYHYMIVQAADFSTFGRDARAPLARANDNEDGIYWLNIGNDKGIVKSIKFKKTDLPGLRESRQEREGSLGLGQLRDKYDADVNLFGNNLFQPGQIIYINPTVIGLSAPGFATRLSSVLGIGGYHQIISVDNAISDNTYETILNTKWVAAGTGFDPYEADPCDVPRPDVEPPPPPPPREPSPSPIPTPDVVRANEEAGVDSASYDVGSHGGPLMI